MKFGTPTNEQLEKINKLAKRALSTDEVFVFSGKSAGDIMIPNRYTQISPELLQIMVDDAKKGVSFMLNHNWSNWGGIQGVPYGKVFDGRIVDSYEEGETKAMYLDKYIFRDDEVTDGISANALIKKIESGILSDTSISFSTDVMKCSICGKNYYSRECSHYRGAKYEMGDGTQKVCTLTALPPTNIIPYNNNALYEESIVWDGAYPGAVVSQSKSGDIIELPTGNFTVVGDKEELPEHTLFYNKYHNGNMLILTKKSEHKKLYNLGEIKKDDKKGADLSVNEKALKALEALGITYKEGETKINEELFNQIGEKWDAMTETIKASVEPMKPLEATLSEEYLGIPIKEIKDKLGNDTNADNLLELAKEGQSYRQQLIDDTIAMGTRAQGNDFKVETWKIALASMDSKAINDIMQNFAKQAGEVIPAGRKTDIEAGAEKQSNSLPDEAFRV